MDSDPYLAVHRTLSFFPFFVAGALMREKGARNFLNTLPRWVYVVVLAVCFKLVLIQNYDPFFLSGRVGYKFFYPSPAAGVNARLFFYAITLVICISFLSLMSTRQTILSAMGRRTLYAYLAHGFIIVWLQRHGLFIKSQTLMGEAMLIVWPLILTVALCSPIAEKVLRYLVYPQRLWGVIKASG